jgi:uncharacterized protein YbbK (DUF523 family)
MAQPRIVISRCFGFDTCRYDGSSVTNDIVDKLTEFVQFITVCPEVDIGMSVPRKPINLQKVGNKNKIIQADTFRDYSEALSRYAEETLDGLGEVSAFIFKCCSPSCGLGSAKLYDAKGEAVIDYVNGVFSECALNKYPEALFLDEEKLNEMGLENLLKKII